ncbi:MAG: hypothetical protein ABIX12_04995 [Rubrivivax sp.]
MSAATRWLEQVAVTAAVLLLAACGGGGGGDAEPSAAPLVLETAGQTSAVIGSAGGTLETSAASGARYWLSIPASALRDPVRVTITPVSAATGALGKAGLVAAVLFEPEGLQFARTATLTIELPLGTPTSGHAGVVAASDGSAPHLVPTGIDARRVAIPIAHFSVAGVVTDAQSIPAPPAGAVREVAEQVIGEALGFLTPTPDAATVQTITDAFHTWYQASVRVKLQAAANASATDSDTVAAMSENDAWLFSLGLASVELGAPAGDQLLAPLSSQVTEGRTLAAAALRAAIVRANQACLAQPSNLLNALTAAGNGLYWQDLAERGLLAGPGADQASDLVRPAVLEALCVKVAYDSFELAQQLTIGQTVPLQVRVGFSVGGGAPLFSALLDVEVQPVGAVAVAGQPLGGPTDVDGFFATQLAVEQNAVVVNVHACGVTLGNYLERICGDTLVTRNSLLACPEHTVQLGSQSASGTGTAGLNVGVASAIASASAGGVTSGGGLNGTARSADSYQIDAPAISGPFQAVVRFRAALVDLVPDFPGQSGSVTLTYPGGSQTFTEFNTVDRDIPITLHHGDVVRLQGEASATETSGVSDAAGAAASYSIFLTGWPAGVRLIEANCP